MPQLRVFVGSGYRRIEMSLFISVKLETTTMSLT